MLAADKGSEPAGARLEPALDHSLADDAPSLDWLGKTFEVLQTHLLERECSAY